MQSIKQTIFGKKYKLLIAKTDKQKKKGMNIFSKPQKGIGMIFPYRQEKPNRSFTLAKCPFSLKVIFHLRMKERVTLLDSFWNIFI